MFGSKPLLPLAVTLIAADTVHRSCIEVHRIPEACVSRIQNAAMRIAQG
jgi:hypothetical protein